MWTDLSFEIYELDIGPNMRLNISHGFCGILCHERVNEPEVTSQCQLYNVQQVCVYAHTPQHTHRLSCSFADALGYSGMSLGCQVLGLSMQSGVWKEQAAPALLLMYRWCDHVSNHSRQDYKGKGSTPSTAGKGQGLSPGARPESQPCKVNMKQCSFKVKKLFRIE